MCVIAGLRIEGAKYMPVVLAVLGSLLLFIILLDVFETIILPRRITRKLRLARGFYRATWRPWSAVGRMMRATNRRSARFPGKVDGR